MQLRICSYCEHFESSFYSKYGQKMGGHDEIILEEEQLYYLRLYLRKNQEELLRHNLFQLVTTKV